MTNHFFSTKPCSPQLKLAKVTKFKIKHVSRKCETSNFWDGFPTIGVLKLHVFASVSSATTKLEQAPSVPAKVVSRSDQPEKAIWHLQSDVWPTSEMACGFKSTCLPWGGKPCFGTAASVRRNTSRWYLCQILKARPTGQKGNQVLSKRRFGCGSRARVPLAGLPRMNKFCSHYLLACFIYQLLEWLTVTTMTRIQWA